MPLLEDGVKEGERDGEVDCEEDFVGERVPEMEMLVERVRVGELDRLGEVESVEDTLDVGQGDNERVGERDGEGLRVIDGEAE